MRLLSARRIFLAFFKVRLKVEIYSQLFSARRTAHQCHTRPIWLRTQPRFIGTGQNHRPCAPALPAALRQDVFEASASLETRLVCFSPYRGKVSVQSAEKSRRLLGNREKLGRGGMGHAGADERGWRFRNNASGE